MSKKMLSGGLLAVLLFVQLAYAIAGAAPAGEEVSFTFNLHKGWNLISLPVLTSFTAESFGSVIGSSVKYFATTYNAATGEQKTYVSEVSAKDDDFEIKPDSGYFVFVTGDLSFTVTGQKAGVRTVPLYKGVNIVGWTSLEKSTAADAFAATLGSNLINASKRNSDGSFQTYTPGVSGKADDFAVEPGQGYLLYVERDCILTYGAAPGPAGEMLQKESVSGSSFPVFEVGAAIGVLLLIAFISLKRI